VYSGLDIEAAVAVCPSPEDNKTDHSLLAKDSYWLHAGRRNAMTISTTKLEAY
jgi:hypothetical protein